MAVASASRWCALGALLGPDRRRWTGLGLLVALGSASALSGPLVVRRVVDEAGDGVSAAEVARSAVLFLAIAVTTQVVAVVVVRVATGAAWRTTNELRVAMARHVLELDHEFHRRHTPGELIQRVDGDVTSVSDFLGTVVPKVAGAVFLVIGMIGVLAVLDGALAVGMVVYVGLAVTAIVRSRHRAVSESSDEMGALARLYGGIEERLTAAEDLRANGAANHASWRFVEDSSAALESAVRRERAFLVMWWFVQSAVAAGTVLVLVAGAALLSRGLVSLGTVFLLFQYVLLIARPLEAVVHELETVQKASGAMGRVFDLLAVRATITDRGTTSPPPGPPSIELRGVHFDYGDDQPVLRDVSVALGAGRSVGIVGRTGSGKTTFSRLVLRLVDATRGEVLVGGVPVQQIPLRELRRRVALVPQEVELFGGTIRDNVTLFDAGPPDERVVEALLAVGLDAMAAAGIHRRLGAGGAGLSAGEAQLLALARVWLRDPDVVVLDEATARVDPETEARLDAAIRRLVRGRTTLVIAHRLSTLRGVDDIVVFDHGRVVEQGPRRELVGDDDSRFAQLLRLSLEREEVAADGARPSGVPVGAGSAGPLAATGVPS
jgi:ATP-binding cassette subfamily B protein